MSPQFINAIRMLVETLVNARARLQTQLDKALSTHASLEGEVHVLRGRCEELEATLHTTREAAVRLQTQARAARDLFNQLVPPTTVAKRISSKKASAKGA